MKDVSKYVGMLIVVGLVVPVLLLGFTLVPNMVEVGSAFGGGDGSEGDPYVITNVWELQNMSLDLDANYTLGN
ncbi:MAG: hypothetical protein ACTSPB_00820, partial [Candidatus Thorarchaeota archaeon]